MSAAIVRPSCKVDQRLVPSNKELEDSRSRLDPTRGTVLLVSEASRTNASILACAIAMRLRRRYNIVALLLSGTDLVGEFENCCAAVIGPLVDRPLADAEHALKRLSDSFPIDYAIANSAKMTAII